MKSRFLLAALAAAFAVNAGAATLRIATEPTFPPFESVDTKTHEYVGFDMDLIRLIAKKAGYTPVIESVGFDAIVPGLITGTTDVGAAGITITPERAKRVLFTDPYYDAGLSIIVHRDDKAKTPSKAKRSAYRSVRRVPCVPEKLREPSSATSTRCPKPIWN